MDAISQLISLSLTLFLLMDPVGNVPLFLSSLKRFDAKRRKAIILRELLFALAIIVLFYFVGDKFLSFLAVEQYSVEISGGILLFIIALKMIFPSSADNEDQKISQEPFIVPLAIPFVAGPAVLAVVIVYSHQQIPSLIILSSIFIAWALNTLLLLAATRLQKLLGEKGIIASERLMGLILILISVQMFLKGINSFVTTCP